MESSKEQIEAQLCAYIDGELNDAERAEIERHLESNPQHKALIAELRSHSGLLQDLPRAVAPLELNEALCGQLERSALLNSSDEEQGQTILSINRWPQITAVAAVLMLAIGLGIVVYYVLPPSGANTRGPLAVDDKKIHLPISDGEKAGKDRTIPNLTDRLDDSKSITTPLSAKRAASDQSSFRTQPEFDPASARAAEIKDGRLITAKEVEALRQRTNMVLHGGNDAFNLDNSSLCLVVSTNNTAAANNQVAAYFKSNRILYMTYDDSMALADGVSGGAGGKAGTGITFDFTEAAPDPAKDKYSSRKAGSEPAGGSASEGRAGGVPESGFGRGGKSGDAYGAAQTFDRSETKAPANTHEEELAAKPTPVAEGTRGVRLNSNLQEPAQVSGAAPAKPDLAATEDYRIATENEAEASKADRDKTGAAHAGETRDKNRLGDPILGRNEATLESRVRERVLSSAQAATQPEPRDSSRSWQLQDNTARAQIVEKIAEDPTVRNGVIIARMNRRQANELSAVLSREQGQRTQLTRVNVPEKSKSALAEVEAKKPAERPIALHVAAASDSVASGAAAPVTGGRGTPAPGTPGLEPAAPSSGASNPKPSEPAELKQKKELDAGAQKLGYALPTTLPAETLAKQYKHESMASDELRIVPDPLDEPVDVFILVTDDSAPGVPQIQLTAPKTSAEPVPANDQK